MEKRTALNVLGGNETIACCTIRNVDPQIKAMKNSVMSAVHGFLKLAFSPPDVFFESFSRCDV